MSSSKWPPLQLDFFWYFCFCLYRLLALLKAKKLSEYSHSLSMFFWLQITTWTEKVLEEHSTATEGTCLRWTTVAVRYHCVWLPWWCCYYGYLLITQQQHPLCLSHCAACSRSETLGWSIWWSLANAGYQAWKRPWPIYCLWWRGSSAPTGEGIILTITLLLGAENRGFGSYTIAKESEAMPFVGLVVGVEDSEKLCDLPRILYMEVGYFN